MKVSLLLTILCLSLTATHAQIDTAALLRNAKLRLAERFQVGTMSENQYMSYCKLRLTAELIPTEGFRNTYLFAIKNQTLWADSVSQPGYLTRKGMPQSVMRDEPFSNSFIIAVSANSGRTYALAGFESSDIEEMIYHHPASGKLTNKDLDYAKNNFKIEGFEFALQKGRLALLPVNKVK